MMLTTFHACLVLSHAIIMYSQLIESHEIPPRIFWETRTYKQRNEHENYCLPGCAVWQLCTDVSEESNASILYFEMKAGVSKEYVNGHQTTSDYSSFVFIIPFGIRQISHTINRRYSTIFVCVPPHIICLQLCTPKVFGA